MPATLQSVLSNSTGFIALGEGLQPNKTITIRLRMVSQITRWGTLWFDAYTLEVEMV